MQYIAKDVFSKFLLKESSRKEVGYVNWHPRESGTAGISKRVWVHALQRRDILREEAFITGPRFRS